MLFKKIQQRNQLSPQLKTHMHILPILHLSYSNKKGKRKLTTLSVAAVSETNPNTVPVVPGPGGEVSAPDENGDEASGRMSLESDGPVEERHNYRAHSKCKNSLCKCLS